MSQSETNLTETGKNATKRIGMIGVGLMGIGIARNLIKKDFPLNYLRHEGNQPTSELDNLGACGFDMANELAAQSDIILLCVTGTPQVEEILLGSTDLLRALLPGTIIVDCSTAIPASTLSIAEKVEAAGSHFVDAAMTRTPKEANEGRLNLLIGGAPEIIEQVMPVLEAFSENRTHAGPVGAGHRLKLLHNFVSIGAAALLSEAAACSRASGIDDALFVECLRNGGGHGAALDRIAPFLLEGETEQMRFTIENSLKDLTYYNHMAEELDTGHLFASAAQTLMDQMVSRNMGAHFVPELVELMKSDG